MAGSATVKLEKDGQVREVASAADQVRLEFNGWKVVKSKEEAPKKASSTSNQ